jgi:hypothetical protein
VSPAPITSIGALPFARGPVLDVLGFADDRDHVDHDYTGFGWTLVDRLWLVGASGAPRRLDDALVLALHAADDGPALADDVLLEFALPDQVLTARLSTFLVAWLPRLPARRATVLALCNPHRAALPGPPGVHHALGPVDSWLDETPDGDTLRLVADAWRQCPDLSADLSTASEAP